MRRTVVIAHNGGNFGPDNSMKNFKGAIEKKAEGIEFDVSPIFTKLPFVIGVAEQRQRACRNSWRSKR